MTTNVNVYNHPGHWNVKIFRRYKDGTETQLSHLNGGETGRFLTLWDNCELVIREVEPEHCDCCVHSEELDALCEQHDKLIEGPHAVGKNCFTYCGDNKCDCEAKDLNNAL